MMANPYEAPLASLDREIDPLAKIKARLARPATALIIMASIQSVFIAIYLVSVIFIVARGGMVANQFYDIAYATFEFIALILIAIGAAKMGFLESFRMARIAAILACIPMVSPFLVWGIPFGIWSLRLLSDPEVQAAFPPRGLPEAR